MVADTRYMALRPQGCCSDSIVAAFETRTCSSAISCRCCSAWIRCCLSNDVLIIERFVLHETQAPYKISRGLADIKFHADGDTGGLEFVGRVKGTAPGVLFIAVLGSNLEDAHFGTLQSA